MINILNKENLVKEIERQMVKMFAKKIEESNNKERMLVLSHVIKSSMMGRLAERNANENNEKEVHYFSMEYLLGKQMKSMITNLGIEDTVNNALDELGWDLDAIIKVEPEPASGNGGLGRLAACFMDSMACNGIRGYGQGLRYKSGLFKQRIVGNEQKELPDRWLDNGVYPWDTREEDTVIVKIRGNVRFETVNGRLEAILENYKPILAVPYDIPVPGYHNGVVNYLRLWNAEHPTQEMLEASGLDFYNIKEVLENKKRVDEITDVLYPDDSTYEGKELRLKQEYFMCSAGLQSLVNKFKSKGIDLRELDKYLSVHINDTHPTLCIPELIRILIDEEKLSWDEAWKVTTNVCSYTNHTIMQEALEKWPSDMVQSLIPRVYMIIQEIDRRYVETLNKEGYNMEKINRMRIIDGYGNIHMANMCCIVCHSINGVAELHTNILKEETLNDYYKYTPWKFNNKTNGIAHRRWLLSANPELAELIDEMMGSDSWRQRLDNLGYIAEYVKNPNVFDALDNIKYNNKVKLANFIKNKYNIDIDPNSIFDMQIKRIHAYKRQLMNLLRCIVIYNDLLDNPNMDFKPMTVMFAGKAAASYREAKNVIKAINMFANIVNNDKRINGKLKILFIENYNVSKAEIMIPAADISEQIPTASKEASGTSNFKFMMNGALTLATLDGANVEMAELVGEDNIFIFGLRKDEVINRYNTWYSFSTEHIINNNPTINRAMNLLRTLNNAGNELYWNLRNNDHFFVLTDLMEYVNTTYKMNELYRTNKREWNKKCLINIAATSKFTTDRTIEEYSNDIWFK